MSAITPEMLELICCPDTHQPLAVASDDHLTKINAAIRDGSTQNVGGDEVTEVLKTGLIRKDKKILYPIRDGIPILLIEEGIELAS